MKREELRARITTAIYVTDAVRGAGRPGRGEGDEPKQPSFSVS